MHRRSLSRLTAAAILLVVGLAACGSSGAKSGSPSTTVTGAAAVPALLDKALKEHVAGKLDDAVRDYNAVVAADPTNKFGHYNLGLIHQDRKQTAAAEREYRLALNTDPKYVPALYNLAILVSNDGDTSGAIVLYRKAIAADARDANAHFNLGLLLIKEGQREQGQLEVAAAIKIDPNLAKRPTAGQTTPTT
jgi:tetratricopeptide (TPR) repeat protein